MVKKKSKNIERKVIVSLKELPDAQVGDKICLNPHIKEEFKMNGNLGFRTLRKTGNFMQVNTYDLEKVIKNESFEPISYIGHSSGKLYDNLLFM